VLDEIGRGTSTYDGMSLAQAILVYLVSRVRCLSLFSTHYHELTRLNLEYPQIQNAHMKVGEKNKEIHFLYSLETGPANKSYGIEVARLAGLPGEVTSLAKKILEAKEKTKIEEALPLFAIQNETEPVEEVVPNPQWVKIIQDISAVSVSSTSPLEALNKIHQWQKELLV
jgi:DNA mismatch repair protein MutS